ncbi:MAG: hypothetical protein H6569_00710 [Lewinellaceae bacterium]|nr:hypothetical protein [Lewinellaceae bacterium]
MSKFRLFLQLSLCFLFALKAAGQISIDNVDEIGRLKKSITYVAMKDTASEVAQQYKAIFRKYWTISKVEFITYDDILNYVSDDASFFTIGGYTTTSTFMRMSAGGGQRPGLSYENTHLYYELWVTDPKVLEKWKNRKKKKDELPDSVKKIIGRIELYTDFETLAKPENIYQSDYDGGGHIYNWGPGYLKNDIQLLMALLGKDEKRWLFKSETDEKQIKKLKKETLYVPDYVLIKFNKFNGDESKRHDEKDLLSDYKLPYKLISNAELNRKIIEETEPFYYLVYIKSSTDKYVSVYNSQTGEMVYTTYTGISYNLKDKDFGKLENAVSRK